MTPQLANQFATLAVKLAVLVLVPLLAYLLRNLINEGLASIQDVRVRNAAAQLVSTAEATLAVAGKGKFAFVLKGLQDQFPALPIARFTPVIEDEVAKLHIKLGKFTPEEAPATPAPAPLPVFDTAAVKSALAAGLTGLVPDALAGQVSDVISSAFAKGFTTIDKATSPVDVAGQVSEAAVTEPTKIA